MYDHVTRYDDDDDDANLAPFSPTASTACLAILRLGSFTNAWYGVVHATVGWAHTDDKMTTYASINGVSDMLVKYYMSRESAPRPQSTKTTHRIQSGGYCGTS